MNSFVTRKGLVERGITYSDGYLLTLESRGEFPKRMYLSPRKVVWVSDEVSAWAEQKIAERDAEQAAA